MTPHPVLLLLVLQFLIADSTAQAQGKHLFILAGQSNMEGLNPELVFKPMVQEAFGEESCIIVKDAEGGQSIVRWYKHWDPIKGGPIPIDRETQRSAEIGDLYDRLLRKVRHASRQTKLSSVTFCWMQGESDTYHPRCLVYEESLLGLVAQLQKDLRRDGINVVVGRISDARMHVPEWVEIRRIQVRLAEAHSNWSWVDTDDCNDGPAHNGSKVYENDVHYSDEGRNRFASRLAEEAIELVNRSSPD